MNARIPSAAIRNGPQRRLLIRAESLLITMPPRKTFSECREKISEMIGEAVVEDDAARRTGLLTLADLWVEVAKRRKDDETPRSEDPWDPV